MATHFSIRAGKIPWKRRLAGYSQRVTRVSHHWSDLAHSHTQVIAAALDYWDWTLATSISFSMKCLFISSAHFSIWRPTFKCPKKWWWKELIKCCFRGSPKRGYFKEEMVIVWTLKVSIRISNWACNYFTTLYYRRLPNPLKKKN